jgi:hypothetical protein
MTTQPSPGEREEGNVGEAEKRQTTAREAA